MKICYLGQNIFDINGAEAPGGVVPRGDGEAEAVGALGELEGHPPAQAAGVRAQQSRRAIANHRPTLIPIAGHLLRRRHRRYFRGDSYSCKIKG